MTAVTRITRAFFLAAMLAGATVAMAEDDPFQRIKHLEGSWLAVSDKGEVTDQVVSVFRVTSNGHTVEEVMFPGTASEMVNMYYRDGNDVRMTHYCAGGNQPTLRLLPTPKPGVLQLEFYDITNMLTIDDEHMHEAQYQWVDDHHLRTEWRSFRDGRHLETVKFDMVRRR